jgi:hypothetical protein
MRSKSRRLKFPLFFLFGSQGLHAIIKIRRVPVKDTKIIVMHKSVTKEGNKTE